MAAVSSVTTGPSGRFEQDGLAPGEYSISVRAAGHASNDLETVRVQSGEESEVRLAVDTGVTALVKLEDPEGQASRLRVEVFDGEDHEVGGLITAQQLRSLFNKGAPPSSSAWAPCPPGRYTVRATSPEGDVDREARDACARATRRSSCSSSWNRRGGLALRAARRERGG